MRTLNIQSVNNFSIEIYACAKEKTACEFRNSALETLKKYIPFDIAIWGTGTMKTNGIDIHSLHLHNTTQEMLQEYAKIKHLDSAAKQCATAENITIGFKAHDLFKDSASTEINQFIDKYKHHNIFITSRLNKITNHCHWLSLYRTNPEHTCKPDEIRFLSLIFSNIIQAQSINYQIHYREQSTTDSTPTWTLAITDESNNILHIDHGFVKLAERDWRFSTPQSLPTEISHTKNPSKWIYGKHITIQIIPKDNLFIYKARPRHPIDSLTRTEIEIANLLAKGLSQKEIAQNQKRSPETIRTHIKNIFKKTRINNSIALTKIIKLRKQDN